MRVMILGADGYLGWPTCQYLSKKGHTILGVDSFSKRLWEDVINVRPLWPAGIERLDDSPVADFCVCDISKDSEKLYKIFDKFEPDAVIHYAEQPSAPYSMMTRGAAVATQQNNVIGTLNLLFAVAHHNPQTHIIKLGTMGEYGTPRIPIEEGWLDIEHKGYRDRVLYPKRPGSFYHLSKVHDSHNLEFACRCWGLRVTDLNQGIVYGVDRYRPGNPGGATSFHYDAVFGTVLNRFIVQAALGEALTVYGHGGQRRGFLDIRDTLKCVELALENPPEEGEFRVFNQFTQVYSVLELAELIANNYAVEIDMIPNPRVEEEDHFYMATHEGLPKLGLEPHFLDAEQINDLVQLARRYADNVDRTKLKPDIRWKQE